MAAEVLATACPKCRIHRSRRPEHGEGSPDDEHEEDDLVGSAESFRYRRQESEWGKTLGIRGQTEAARNHLHPSGGVLYAIECTGG
jgi:hypothetical protein